MIPFLITAWTKPWVRYAVAALAIAGLLLSARAYYIHHGKTLGREEQKTESNQDDANRQAADRTATNELLKRYATALDASNAKTERLMLMTQQLVAANADLARRRNDQAAAVAKIPDSELHSYVIDVLKLRRPEDKTPGYLPVEERAIAKCVSEFPTCQEQVTKLNETVNSQADTIKSGLESASIQTTQYDTLAAYTNRLEGSYVDLYNRWPQKRNWLLTIVTAGVKGKPRPMGRPEPFKLQGATK